MDFTYKKHDNQKLFSSLEKIELGGVKQLQNYIPLYSKFFLLNETNCDTINLNNVNYLHEIRNMKTENIGNGIIKNINKKDNCEKKVFLKYSPLLDPIKYLIGKYNIEDPTLLNLPSINNQPISHEKLLDTNNSAYIDSFFSYLTSKLLNDHDFIHGLDFYGSFLAIKKDFRIG